MSVDKNKPDYLIKNKLPFTIIVNETVNNITDCAALGIYIYLSTKPDNWVICKEALMNHFKKGRDFIEARLKYLKQLGALVTKDIRDDKGRFIKRETHLNCILSTTLKTQDVDNPEPGESAPTNTRYKKIQELKNTNTPPYNPSSISEPVDNSTSIRIEHQEEEEKSNSIFSYEQPPKHPSKPIAPKTAISTSPQKSIGASKQLTTTNPKTSPPPQPINQSTSIAELLNPRANQLIGTYNLTHEDLMTFEYLWQAYPTKLNRIKCEHAWFGNGYHHQAEQILLKFAEQLDKDRRFKTKKYTPHLINYINRELWHDEIIEEKADKEKGVGGFDHEDTSWIYKKDIFD